MLEPMPSVAIICGQAIVPVPPREERYRLGDQPLRAARATTADIAEGYGRFHYLDNAKSCSNARGSCWETLDHLITGSDEGLIATELLNQGRTLVNEAVKVLNGYMSYLKRAHRTCPATDNE
jgi:four helix bundle protein